MDRLDNNNHILLLIILIIIPSIMCKFYCRTGSNTDYETHENVTITAGPGKIIGKIYKSENGVKAQVYQGVPYATQTRFQYSVLLKTFPNRTLDATKTQKICYQFGRQRQPGLEQTEDCLLLTIVAPYQAADAGPHPVLLWIHGGGFATGTGNMRGKFDGVVDNYASRGVVFVSLQYRLGALGFLYQANGPNNLGLYDQNTAVQFVADNIAAFGGDPNQITVAGQSAGAISASYIHSFNGLPLVRRSIAMSGSQLKLDALGPAAELATRSIAAGTDCAYGANMARCLRNVAVGRLVTAAAAVARSGPCARFMPTVDGMMVQANRTNSLLRPRGDVMIGITADELPALLAGKMHLSESSMNAVPESELREWFRRNVQSKIECMPMSKFGQAELVARLALYKYLDAADVDVRNRSVVARALVDAVQEATFALSALKEAQLSAANAGNSVWLYDFAYSEPGLYKPPMPGFPVRGPYHGGDLRYVFATGPRRRRADYRFNRAECDMIERLSGAIALFVKTGQLPWPRISKEQPDVYMSFNGTSTVKRGFHTSAIAFWDRLICNIVQCY